MTRNIECTERIQAVVDELTAEGASQTVIVASLIEVIVQTAYEDHRYADALLEGVSLLISEAIEATRLSKDLIAARKTLAAHRRKRGKPRKKKK